MIHLSFDNIEALVDMHCKAVLSYILSKSAKEIDELYASIKEIINVLPPERVEDDNSWIREFIAADVNTLEWWVANKADKLRFGFFKKLYENRFAAPDAYVDTKKTYNAYTLIHSMGIHVCPYCEDEYFDEIETPYGKRRTCDFDHFYPKAEYPALAMCFFNLVPSGKVCNYIMNKYPVEANPYHPDIEHWSTFHCDIPIGSNYESLPVESFTVTLSCTSKMVSNEKLLDLTRRYSNRHSEIRKILLASRFLSTSYQSALKNMGVPQNHIDLIIQSSLGCPYPQGKGFELHQKLRYDLTGY